MPGGMTLDPAAPHAPASAFGAVDQNNSPTRVGSKLAGRAQIAVPSQPRMPSQQHLGILQRIGRALGSLLKCLFQARQASPARMPPTPAQRQRDFRESLHNVRDTLLSRNATSDTIAESLRHAAATGRKLRPEEGSQSQLSHNELQQLVEKATPSELERLAIALGSDNVSGARNLLADNAEATHILTELKAVIDAELGRRVESNVNQEVEAAVQAVKNGAPAERVTEHLRLAFASTALLARSGSLTTDDARLQAEATVRQLVLNRLEYVEGQETRGSLLAHLSHQDLALLSKAAERSGRPIERALSQEIQQRPQRIAADLQNRSQHFLENRGARAPVDRYALLRDLSGITRALVALEHHDMTFRAQTGSPPNVDDVKQSVSKSLENAITSGKVDLTQLSASELRELSSAFSALGVAEAGGKLLATARQDAIKQRGEALGQSLTALGEALITADKPEELLKQLSQTAAASSELRDTGNTFSGPSHQPDGSRAVDDAIQQWLAMPAKDGTALRDAITGPNFKPLIEDLNHAEERTRQAHQTSMAEDFKRMGLLLGRIERHIEREVGAPASAAATAPVARESVRQALAKLYGITITGQHTTLNAGYFTPELTRRAAAEIERPLSDNERSVDKVGTQEVPHQFLADARRKKPRIWLAGGASNRPADASKLQQTLPLQTTAAARADSPLIDYDKWSKETPEADVHASIAEGYERLLEFCAGDAEQARALARLLNQHVAAGLLVACMGEDSPLQLDDGTVGTFAAESAGGRVDLDITLSMGENGRPRLEVSSRFEGRQTFLATDGSRVMLSPDSRLEMNFSAELDNESLKLLGSPSYRFSLKRDDFQKDYQPPTATSLRGMSPEENALMETVNYASTRGKDYQITAMRAADAFQREPTLANAAAVIAECDRGGSEGAALVSEEVRGKVRTESERSKQTILAAFKGAKATAKRLIKREPDHKNAHLFLRQRQELDTKTGTDLLEAAERLHREFSRRAGDGRTLPFEPLLAAHIGQRLATEREKAAQHTFSPDLFGNLADTLGERLDNELLPDMIAAAKREV